MAGCYTTIIREIVLRLNSAYVSLGLKALQVLPREARLQPDLMPYVLIYPDTQFIVEEYGSNIRQNQKGAAVNLVLSVSYPIVDRDGDNTIYETGYIVDDSTNYIIDNAGFLLASEVTGFVPFIEKILDAINTNSTNQLSPQLTDNPTRSMGITVQNVVKNEASIDCEILISVATDKFTINNRQNA